MIRQPPRSTLFPYTTPLPIFPGWPNRHREYRPPSSSWLVHCRDRPDRIGEDDAAPCPIGAARLEEHTSELQSRPYLVCRLLLEKKYLTLPPTHILLNSTYANT